MAGPRKKKQAKNGNPSIFVPAPKPSDAAGLGAAPRRIVEAGMRVAAQLAGKKSRHFPKGGSAFEAWCAEKGVHITDTRPIEAWEDLLKEFAARPVHGLRRGPDGGDHRANKRDLRRS